MDFRRKLMKHLKKFLSLLAVMTMAFTIGAATACNDKGDSSSQSATESSSESSSESATETAYAVTVLKPDGTPAANISLNFCVGATCQSVMTDANGVATFAFTDASTVYHVEFNNPFSTEFGYTDFNTTPGTLTYTMTLNPYTAS